MEKGYRVYISREDGRTRQEVARFTSKGLMYICLDSIRKTYQGTEYHIEWDMI
jgi:hypothetical protein